MESRTNLVVLIKEPEALRGLDRLIECARRVLERDMPLPEREPAQKPLARTA
jgi:hypothetical protein